MAAESSIPTSVAPDAPSSRVRFCVGVSGHRLNGLRAADLPLLRQRVRECLQLIAAAVGSRRGGSHLVAVSPLAEGSDQLVADEALALGYELHAPLPFAQSEYERDFSRPESLAEFRRLLAHATRVEELDGSRARDAEAYARVGRLVLDRSDLLIAIWDGREARGNGGTGQIVLDAIHRGLLTVWIRAEAPHSAALVQEDRTLGVREEPLARLPLRLARSGSEG